MLSILGLLAYGVYCNYIDSCINLFRNMSLNYIFMYFFSYSNTLIISMGEPIKNIVYLFCLVSTTIFFSINIFTLQFPFYSFWLHFVFSIHYIFTHFIVFSIVSALSCCPSIFFFVFPFFPPSVFQWILPV